MKSTVWGIQGATTAEPHAITRLLRDWGGGNKAALDELTPHVYRELYSLARAYLRRSRPNQTLQPTALINEAYLRLIDQTEPLSLENRSHFFGVAARLMRSVLVDYTRAHHAAKRGGGEGGVTLLEDMAVAPGPAPGVLDIDDSLNRLAELDERKAKVIELRYFGGMTREEIADALNLTLATVKRDLRLAEAWLRNDIAGRR